MVDRPNDEEQRLPTGAGEQPPAEESSDFVADIRQEMTLAETERPAPRQGLLKRVTGLLRRKKDSKPLEPAKPEDNLVLPTIEPVLFTPEENDDLPAPEAPAAQPLQEAPPARAPAITDFDDDFLAGQLDVESDDLPLPPVAPARSQPATLFGENEESQADTLRAQLLADDAIPDTPGPYTDALGALATFAEEALDEEPDALRALMTPDEEETPASRFDALAPDAGEAGALPAGSPGSELPRRALFDDDLMRPETGPDLFAPEPDEDQAPAPAASLFDDDLMRPETGPDPFAPQGADGEDLAPGAPTFDDDLMQPEPGAETGPAAPAGELPAAPEAPQPARPRGLRRLLTGILRPGEERRRQQAERDALDDQVVTSRLSRSLGQEMGLPPQDEPMLESGHEPMSLTPGAAVDDDEPNWDRLILAAGPLVLPRRADQTLEDEQQKDDQEERPLSNKAQTELPPYEAEPEEQQPVGPPRPADLVDNERLFWEGAVPTPGLPDSDETIEDRLSDVGDPYHEHDRHIWEGGGVAQTKPLTSAPLVPIDEMRSMVLEDYDERGAQIEVEGDSHIDMEVEKRHGVRRRATLSRLERVLLGVLIVLALSLAAALALLFIRPPEQIAAIITRPTGAPLSGAMLPTGIEIPGGWYFGLERNTLVDGKWEPQAAEWLEGSELPRVVAIPWNRQTEAVIQTFEAGDQVRMFFGNNTNIDYRVREVKRVDVNDVSVFQERRPSLVVVLYQEDALQRWVIVCGR